MKKIVPILITLLALKTSAYGQWNAIYANQTFTSHVGVKQISSPKTNVIYACVFDTSNMNPTNQFFRTIDNGVTWALNTINTPGGQMDITSISAVNKDTAWAAINKHGGGVAFSLFYSKILKTTDGGTNWTTQSSAAFTGPANHINFIHFSDPNNGICVGDSNTGFWEIYKTINGGTNWNRIVSANIPANLSNEKGSDNCFDTYNNIIWFGTTRGRVYKSLDLGLTWNCFNTGLNNISNISMRDSLNGIASDGMTLIKTTDGGVTWSSITYNGMFFKNDITENPANPNTYYSVGWQNGNIGSSYTNDGGFNWITIDSLFHTTVNSTTFNVWSGGITSESANSIGYLMFYNWSGNLTGLRNAETTMPDLQLYPNPFSDELHLKMRDFSNYKNCNIEMYDSKGILVEKWVKVDKADAKFDLNHLQKGLYLFKVYDDKDLLGCYKIVRE